MGKKREERKLEESMRARLKYGIVFLVLLGAEVLIAKFGSGIFRSYIGDILVIPTIYFFLRALIFAKDSIFSVYVLPFIAYFSGWVAEVLQAFHIVDRLGISPDSPLAIALGGVFDLRDGLCYYVGLLLIGLFLAVETNWKNDRRWWYPLAVILHCTWGAWQTLGGFFIYLWYFRCKHYYYRGVVRTAWNMNAGLSMGLFIFTPKEPDPEDQSVHAAADRIYCEQVAIHEYGHTIQALLLGPLYLLLIGLPSITWAGLPQFQRMRSRKNIPYTKLYCEKWASKLGEKVTKEKAIWH